MALDPQVRDCLSLPAICAPMFLVSGPDLVREACKAGLVGGLPRNNARSFEVWESWMDEIHAALSDFRAENPDARIGPVAVNITARAPDFDAHLAVCKRHGVRIMITAQGDPTETVKRVHDWGGLVYHDVTNLRFAEKAIAAGVDGLTCIGAGGGGHSGTMSLMSFIPKVRTMFDGTIIMAGTISTGAGIRAAEVLGADLAYLGTRFIATQESNARDPYKQLLVSQQSKDVLYTGKIAGLPANWLVESMRMVGLDPDKLPTPTGRDSSHLPEAAKPWKTIWSAGQGIDLIEDIPTVAELARRLQEEYLAACEAPSMAQTTRQAMAALARVRETTP